MKTAGSHQVAESLGVCGGAVVLWGSNMQGKVGGTPGVRQKEQLVPFNKEVEKEREKWRHSPPYPPLTFDSDGKKTRKKQVAN